jgi:peptidoglycan/LPS O-acetylase OafA/YrhL
MFVQYGSWLPAWLERIMALGRLGVDVFFVLSGYVIAFSVRNGSYTFAFLGRFAVKRSVRLDLLAFFGPLLPRKQPRLGLWLITASP